MSRILALTLVMFASQASAQEVIGQPKSSAGKLVYETWMAASFDGVRAGYVEDSVVEQDVNGMKILRASRRLSLTVRRFGDQALVEAITGTDETPEGKVVGTFMKQQISKNQVTEVRGVVQGNQLLTTAVGQMKFNKVIPWDANVVGTWAELQMVGKLKPSPGTTFDYLIYEPTVNSLVKIQAKAEAFERLELGNETFNLLRVSAQPLPVAGIALPGSTFWYDAKYDMIKSETVMPGMGRLVLLRTSRADAQKPCQGPDLGWLQSIKLSQPLVAPHDDTSITYRIKLSDKNPLEVFARDDRQSVKVISDGVIELVVKGVRQPSTSTSQAGARPGDEFLESNFFITSDDANVKRHATAAVGLETDPWKKSL